MQRNANLGCDAFFMCQFWRFWPDVTESIDPNFKPQSEHKCSEVVTPGRVQTRLRRRRKTPQIKLMQIDLFSPRTTGVTWAILRPVRGIESNRIKPENLLLNNTYCRMRSVCSLRSQLMKCCRQSASSMFLLDRIKPKKVFIKFCLQYIYCKISVIFSLQFAHYKIIDDSLR